MLASFFKRGFTFFRNTRRENKWQDIEMMTTANLMRELIALNANDHGTSTIRTRTRVARLTTTTGAVSAAEDSASAPTTNTTNHAITIIPETTRKRICGVRTKAATIKLSRAITIVRLARGFVAATS